MRKKSSACHISTLAECQTELDRIDDMMKFIEDHADDVKAAFCVFDKQGTGRIPTSKLLTILRTLGMNPSEDELFEIEMDVDGDGNGFIDFIEFLEMMKKLWGNVDMEVRTFFVYRTFFKRLERE